MSSVFNYNTFHFASSKLPKAKIPPERLLGEHACTQNLWLESILSHTCTRQTEITGDSPRAVSWTRRNLWLVTAELSSYPCWERACCSRVHCQGGTSFYHLSSLSVLWLSYSSPPTSVDYIPSVLLLNTFLKQVSQEPWGDVFIMKVIIIAF